MSTEIIAALIVASAAGMMRGFAGVGSGMLMAPFFVHLFDPVTSVGAIILMEAVVTAQLLPSVRNHIEWRVIGPMGAAAALVMPLGSWLLVSLDPSAIQTGVAFLVIVSALVLMTGWRYEGEKPVFMTIGIGLISGILISLTSLGNPPVIVYLLSSRDPAARNRANFTGYFAITLLVLILVMVIGGLFTIHILRTALILLPPFMFMAWIGSRMFDKSNEQFYRIVALAVLLAVGVYALIGFR